MNNKKYLNLIDNSYLEFIKISKKIKNNKFKIEDLENIKNNINLINKKLKKYNKFDVKIGGTPSNDGNSSNKYSKMISDIEIYNKQLNILNGHIVGFFQKILLIFSFLGSSINSNGSNEGSQLMSAFIQPIKTYIDNYLKYTSSITGKDLTLSELDTSGGLLQNNQKLKQVNDLKDTNGTNVSTSTGATSSASTSAPTSDSSSDSTGASSGGFVRASKSNKISGGTILSYNDLKQNGILSLVTGFVTDIISIIGSILILFNTLSAINNNLMIYINKFNFITPESIKLYSQAMQSITPILTTFPKSVPGISVGNLDQLKTK